MVAKCKIGCLGGGWHSIAYFKGPYMLYKLEKSIGEQNMNAFLLEENV